ncbi:MULTISPECIES: hypothetical protein [unclassified Microcoleus]
MNLKCRARKQFWLEQRSNNDKHAVDEANAHAQSDDSGIKH